MRVLGTGAFGVVYQCDNTYLDETVAIKDYLPTDLATRQPDGQIVPLSPATTEAFSWALDRFLLEAKTLWGSGAPFRIEVSSASHADLEQGLALIDEGLKMLPRHEGMARLRGRFRQMMTERGQAQANALLD